MASFVQDTMAQIEIAANFTLAELKATAEAIRDGRHPIPCDERPVTVVEPSPNGERFDRDPNAGVSSNAVLAEAHFQPLDRGPARKLEIAP
jgi:hypothetical protein